MAALLLLRRLLYRMAQARQGENRWSRHFNSLSRMVDCSRRHKTASPTTELDLIIQDRPVQSEPESRFWPAYNALTLPAAALSGKGRVMGRLVQQQVQSWGEEAFCDPQRRRHDDIFGTTVFLDDECWWWTMSVGGGRSAAAANHSSRPHEHHRRRISHHRANDWR
jgi:hypothetical protein